MKICGYFHSEYRFSYLRTKDNVEMDLIVDRPGEKTLCLDIKSSTQINREDITSFINISKDIPNCEAICLSQEKYPKKIEHVTVLPWQQGLKQLFF